jgi:L-ascorbate metabolism protein UlaG (beta-lactamase superfamily)
MRLQHLLPLLSVSLLALPLSAQDSVPQGGPEARPKPKVLGADVTYLANAGFLIQSGRYSVLIDAFLREPVEMYAGLPDEVYKPLVNALPPFDKLTIVLVSHNHPDHVQMRGLEKYLSKNNQAQLMTSPEVLLGLQAQARDFESILHRVNAIPTRPGEVNKILQEEMSIEFFQLEHSGKIEQEGVNMAHLLEIGGVRILHVGDAKPSPENFAPFHLERRAIDVAIVPFWYLSQNVGVRVLQEQINPRNVILCHVPPSELEKLGEAMKVDFPDVILFQKSMEKRSFMPASANPSGKGQ